MAKKGSKWQMIQEQEAFTARHAHIVCPISSDKILICGGKNDSCEFLEDLIVFDTKTAKAKKIGDTPYGMRSEHLSRDGFRNQAYKERDGMIVALV